MGGLFCPCNNSQTGGRRLRLADHVSLDQLLVEQRDRIPDLVAKAASSSSRELDRPLGC